MRGYEAESLFFFFFETVLSMWDLSVLLSDMLFMTERWRLR